jgi:hypothetical protein
MPHAAVKDELRRPNRRRISRDVKTAPKFC